MTMDRGILGLTVTEWNEFLSNFVILEVFCLQITINLAVDITLHTIHTDIKLINWLRTTYDNNTLIDCSLDFN